jgi:hypothetical protein
MQNEKGITKERKKSKQNSQLFHYTGQKALTSIEWKGYSLMLLNKIVHGFYYSMS